MFFQLSLVMLKTQKGRSKNVSKQLQRKIRLVNPRNHTKKPTCPLGFVQEAPKQSRNRQTQNFKVYKKNIRIPTFKEHKLSGQSAKKASSGTPDARAKRTCCFGAFCALFALLLAPCDRMEVMVFGWFSLQEI